MGRLDLWCQRDTRWKVASPPRLEHAISPSPPGERRRTLAGTGTARSHRRGRRRDGGPARPERPVHTIKAESNEFDVVEKICTSFDAISGCHWDNGNNKIHVDTAAPPAGASLGIGFVGDQASRVAAGRPPSARPSSTSIHATIRQPTLRRSPWRSLSTRRSRARRATRRPSSSASARRTGRQVPARADSQLLSHRAAALRPGSRTRAGEPRDHPAHRPARRPRGRDPQVLIRK